MEGACGCVLGCPDTLLHQFSTWTLRSTSDDHVTDELFRVNFMLELQKTRWLWGMRVPPSHFALKIVRLKSWQVFPKS